MLLGEIGQYFLFSQNFVVLQNLSQKQTCGRTKMHIEEKYRALTLLEKEDAVILLI